MSVISIINQKGGCGKTTTSVNLSAALSLRNKKVLLIDLDPQGHSALGFGIDSSENNKTIFNVLMGDINTKDTLINFNEHIDIIPSNILLATTEQVLAGKDGREKKLDEALKEIKNNYDFIIIDCPPNLGFLSINALVASDKAIVPIEPNRFGLHGVEKLAETISMLCDKAGHQIEIKELISMFDIDSAFSNSFAEELEGKLAKSLFKTKIHRVTTIREAAATGQPACFFDEHSVAYVDFMSLAHEVILWHNQKLIKEAINKKEIKSHQTPEGICFLLKTENAQQVQLAGDFNNWDPERNRLEKADSKENIWYTILPLEKGKYNYRYVVDGTYIEDPHNDKSEESLFGVKSSVLVVN